MRFRHLFMCVGSLVAAAAVTFAISQDASNVMAGIFGDWGVGATLFFLGLAAAFYGYRAVTDYPEADGRELHKVAGKEPTGAGLALVARALTLIAMALLVTALFKPVYAAGIPAQAYQHLPQLQAIQRAHFPAYPKPEVLAGQIEHESGCPGLKKMCWNVSARLKSAREDGVGLPQITRAFRLNPDGTRGALRFDALAEMKALHPELAGANWSNIGSRADYQLLVVVLKNRDNWARFRTMAATPEDQMLFALKAYNRGQGGVLAEIKACAAKAGCNPKRFTGHAGNTCTASWKPIYGTRSACHISLAYVPDIVLHRAPKYKGLV
jgi:hypothetical protein